MACAVLVPQGKIALGKLAQALVHGATVLRSSGNFDDCLALARELAENYPVALVNSVNPCRIEGQKTAAFEIVDALGDAPDVHCIPVGNAGNITAYWKGYAEYAADGHGLAAAAHVGLPGRRRRADRPRRAGQPTRDDRDRDPDRQPRLVGAGASPPATSRAATSRRSPTGRSSRPTGCWRRQEGVFVEPASAASVAGLLPAHAAGLLEPGQTVVCTVTGHGLKDPDWAIAGAPAPVTIPADAKAAARPSEPPGLRPPVSAPMFRAQAVRVRVPASSANLGPGLRHVRLWPSASMTIGRRSGHR